MAQGCWSVVFVCATSYSWTTGPHWGAMESPQTAAGTRDPAAPMVAVQAENGSTNLAGMRSPGIGPDGRLVQMSAKIPLRGCERASRLGFDVGSQTSRTARARRSSMGCSKAGRFQPGRRWYCPFRISPRSSSRYCTRMHCACTRLRTRRCST